MIETLMWFALGGVIGYFASNLISGVIDNRVDW